MSFAETQLSKVAELKPAPSAKNGRQLWHYEGVADTVAAAAAAGYFNDARGLLKVGDRIVVVGDSATDYGILTVTAAPATGNVTTAIITGGGGGRIARGQHTTVDENDTVATGLGALAGVIVSLNDDPVDGAMYVTGNIGDQAGAPAAGSFLLKSWKNTDADATHVAATTFSLKVNWIAFEA